MPACYICRVIESLPARHSCTIAAITIGQTPREDMLADLRRAVPDVRWQEFGALDGIDDGELAALMPADDDFPLVTRLGDGRTVIVGERALRPRLQDAVDRAGRAADLIVVLCSGPLDPQSDVPIVCPDRLLMATVRALGAKSIVVLTPAQDQIEQQRARWAGDGIEAHVLAASPYGGTDFAALGRQVDRLHASAAVLDCLGYSLEAKAEFTAASRLPTILARSLVAKIVAELIT